MKEDIKLEATFSITDIKDSAVKLMNESIEDIEENPENTIDIIRETIILLKSYLLNYQHFGYDPLRKEEE